MVWGHENDKTELMVQVAFPATVATKRRNHKPTSAFHFFSRNVFVCHSLPPPHLYRRLSVSEG